MGFTGTGVTTDKTYGDSVFLPFAKSNAIQTDGMISAFYLPSASQSGRIQFQIWRPLKSSYRLIAESGFYETANGKDLLVQVPRSEPIRVKRGDILGFHVEGANPVPYMDEVSCVKSNRLRCVSESSFSL